MHFAATFSTLLTYVCMLGAVQARLEQRSGQAPELRPLSVPIRRVEGTVKVDIPGPIVHAQHVNRANRRHAQLTGRTAPSENELRANIQKRAAELSRGIASRYHRPEFLDTASSIIGNVLQEDGGASQGGENGGITKAKNPNFKDTTGLDIEANDVGYIATLQIGTPAKDYKLLVDSGSADLWVAGEQCNACGNHPHLGSNVSSSFKDTGKQWGTVYGSGSVGGNIVQDTVGIVGLTLEGHTFGVAVNETEQFSGDSTPYDGLLGLAPSKLSTQSTKTLPEALAAAKKIPSAIVSYKLARILDGKNDGAMTLGGLDTNLFDSSTLTTLKNSNSEGFWGAGIDKVTVNGKDMKMSGRKAVFDTGTTLILAPQKDVDALHKAIPGAKKADSGNSWLVPCTLKTPLSLSFGGRAFAVDPRDLAFQPHDSSKPQGDCESGIAVGLVGGDNEWLLGDVFLKNVYFSTDVSKNQVQLAKLT